MADNLAEMITTVRDWSNRDMDQLGDPIITQCLRFAADTAYRQLMIPPLENTMQALIVAEGSDIDGIRTASNIPNTIPIVRVAQGGGEINAVDREARIPVPGDLTTFIHVRIQGSARTDTNGVIMTTGNNIVTNITASRRFGVVFNEKTDVRTYHDLTAEKTNANYWTRQGNQILLNGFLSGGTLPNTDTNLYAANAQAGDVIEIYYYRRLARLGSRFIPPLMVGSTTVSTLTDSQVADMPLQFSTGTAPMGATTYTTTTGTSFFGLEIPNWLINENEKVILFGALWQVFDYLQDQALSQTYFVKFGQAIEELNKEEKDRRASGGNVQVNFNGRGLI